MRTVQLPQESARRWRCDYRKTPGAACRRKCADCNAELPLWHRGSTCDKCRARRAATRRAEMAMLSRCSECPLHDSQRESARRTCSECRKRITKLAIRQAADDRGTAANRCTICGRFVGQVFAGHEHDRSSDTGRLWCEACASGNGGGQ